jgi:hypothetical protein|nr:MAG TPA: Baseplate wedge protein [Caudoviricetes sp.]
MKHTSNYKLKLPEETDTIDIRVLNENFTQTDTLIVGLEAGKANKNSPALTGTPCSTTPAASDNSTRIATTAFVQEKIKNLESKINMIAAAMLDSTYAALLIHAEKYKECHDMDACCISYTEYKNGKTHYDIMKAGSDTVLPKKSDSPVFFLSWADIAGDESEIYNVQALLYSNGSMYARHRYLWAIDVGGNGIVSNPTWSNWSMDDSYIDWSKTMFQRYQ